MTDFFTMIFNGLGDMYDLLDSITLFVGVSVLDFIIAIAVISVIFPILLTIISSMNTNKNGRVDRNAN